MKLVKKILIFISLITIIILGVNHIFYEPTEINSIISSKIYKNGAVNSAFDDENFYKCVVDAYNKTNKTSVAYTYNLSDEELQSISELSCYNRGIVSTNGIEKLTSLLKLQLAKNQITNINLIKNTKLKSLIIDNNKLKEIDLKYNVDLQEIRIAGNQLAELEVSNNLKLIELDIGYWSSTSDYGASGSRPGNLIKELDVSKNTELTALYISENQLTELNVSKNTKLTNLCVSGNQLAELDVSQNTALKSLHTYNNQLTKLDVSKNTELTRLDAYNNQLTKLDISNNTELTWLDTYNNQLTEIDASKNTKLKTLNVYNNKLTSLDVSGAVLLTTLRVDNNQLPKLDISKNTKLTSLNVYKNQLTSLNVSENIELEKLYVDTNQLTELDVSKNTKLTWLDANENQLTSLDVSNNILLTNLNVYKNQLTSLDVSNNTQLKTLWVAYNQLTKLDISNNTLLTNLLLYKNPYQETLYIYKGKNILVKNQVIVPTHLDWDNPTWTSEDSNIAIVDSSGLVTGIKSGTVNVIGMVRYEYDTTSVVNVVEITSDKYVINENDDNIYIGTEKNIDNIKNNITVSHTGIAIKPNNNNLQVKYNEDILKEFKFISINFGKFNEFNKLISVSNKVSYDEFIENITKSDGITYEIYNGTEIVTSGNISEGMKLKVYYKEQEIDAFDITNEYLTFSKNIKVDENKKYLSNISLGTNVDYLLKNIDTTGEIIVTNGEGKEIVGDNILSTGSIVTIKLSKETHQYTVIVRGDTTGDGKVNVTDVSKLYQALRKKIQIEDYFKEAGNVVSTDNEIKITDVTKLYQFARKKISSLED